MLARGKAGPEGIEPTKIIKGREPRIDVRFSLRQLLGLVGGCAIVCAGFGYLLQQYNVSDNAEDELKAPCKSKGGYLTIDLVDKNLIVVLDGCSLSTEDMHRLPELWSKCRSQLALSKRDVYLHLSSATLESDLVDMLTITSRGAKGRWPTNR